MINVLLVDDNGQIRKSVRSLIEKADDIQVVATASNGVDAVDKARSLRPNVTVMDISMPLMDGLEATEHIRECCRLTRVIILSGFDAATYIQRALEVGAKRLCTQGCSRQGPARSYPNHPSGNHYFSAKVAEKYLARKGSHT
jgi:YesN/AraC family two-component response regulator